MQLSEAMRLGAMLSPQGFGTTAMLGASRCALGAAVEAVCEASSDWSFVTPYVIVKEHWPWVRQLRRCPACGDGYAVDGTVWTTMMRTIGHLNDQHRWTREQIADWVATVEPVVEADAVVCPALAGVGG